MNEGYAVAARMTHATHDGRRSVLGRGCEKGNSHGTPTMKPRILEESYVRALMEGSASAMSLKCATFSTSWLRFQFWVMPPVH